MSRLRHLSPVLLIVALLGAPPLPASGETHERARLEQTGRRLEAIQEEIRDAGGSVVAGESALARAERQLADALDAVADAQAAVDRQQRAVDATAARVARYRQTAQRQSKALRERAIRLYKSGGAPPHLTLMSGGTPSELVTRAAIVSQIVAADDRIVEERLNAVVATRAEQEQLENEEGALRDVLSEQRAVMAQVDDIRQNRAIQLAERRSNLAELQQQEGTLETERRQLAATIERMEREAAASRAAAARAAAARAAAARAATAAQERAEAGSTAASSPAAPAAPPSGGAGWIWPTNGTVTSEYGYRWGRMHEGIDIAAPTGTPLVAVRPGTVTFAGTMSGYGYVTLIDHGDGFVTAYAHQNRLIAGAGEQVAQGEQIGEVGSTGRSTGSHVHFEIRVGSSPRNPRSYLP